MCWVQLRAGCLPPKASTKGNENHSPLALEAEEKLVMQPSCLVARLASMHKAMGSIPKTPYAGHGGTHL